MPFSKLLYCPTWPPALRAHPLTQLVTQGPTPAPSTIPSFRRALLPSFGDLFGLMEVISEDSIRMLS
eukprot:gene963-1867_t